jgi:hypothetical protein
MYAEFSYSFQEVSESFRMSKKGNGNCYMLQYMLQIAPIW